jgi:hypothetical protein
MRALSTEELDKIATLPQSELSAMREAIKEDLFRPPIPFSPDMLEPGSELRKFIELAESLGGPSYPRERLSRLIENFEKVHPDKIQLLRETLKVYADTYIDWELSGRDSLKLTDKADAAAKAKMVFEDPNYGKIALADADKVLGQELESHLHAKQILSVADRSLGQEY